MASNFGTLFKITTFGESHCKSVGVIIDGCPPGLCLKEEDIQPQLNRRRPGQSALSTDRREEDQVVILSGTEHGKPRPSHADYTYQMKYGIRAASGGGRSSARETIGSVAAGAVADKILREKFAIDIVGWVESVGTISANPEVIQEKTISRFQVDKTTIRCPDKQAAEKMVQKIADLKKAGDSVGGIIRCVIRGVPAGLGEPTFDKLEARLAQAMLAIPATKGFEIGSGFAGSRMQGSDHNDPFISMEGKLATLTNNSGGIQGGISNGEIICLRIAFKPPATIALPQQSADFTGKPALLEAKGRHDPCVVARAVPIVESMAAIVILDMLMQQKARETLAFT